MTTNQVVEQIRSLSPEDLAKVERALVERKAEVDADVEADRRIRELRSGAVKGLTEDEVVRAAKAELREP